MRDELVTIAVFSHPTEAYIPKTKLESEGIDAFIADENIVTMNWFYSNAVGGVKLQVRRSDVKRARAILGLGRESPHVETESEPDDVSCPFCHSWRVEYGRRGPQMPPLNWIFTLFARPKWYCRDCGHEWRVA